MASFLSSTHSNVKNITLTGNLDNLDIISITQSDLIDEHLKHVLTIIFWFVLQIPVTAFGIVTNVLNIVIFRLSALKDSVSITFTALSISDLGYVTFFFIIRMNALLQHMFHVQSRIHLSWLSYYLSFYAVLFQDVSVVITVFVAIQKCCCVAIPHLFKNVFSPRRTILILIFLSFGILMTYIPSIAGMSFTTVTPSPMSNDTLIVVFRSPIFFKGYNFWMVFSKIVLPASSQGISFICLIVMTVQLKKSSKFRTVAAGLDEGEINSSKAKQSSAKLSNKERRALIAVTLVLVIFVATTVPAAILNYSQLIAKGFFSHPKYQTLRRLLQNSQNIPVHVSASINIFIYLKYNTKYRETAVSLFGKCFYCLRKQAQ